MKVLLAELANGDYFDRAVLTHKPWNPESLLWLGCALMLALVPGAAVANLFEAITIKFVCHKTNTAETDFSLGSK